MGFLFEKPWRFVSNTYFFIEAVEALKLKCFVVISTVDTRSKLTHSSKQSSKNSEAKTFNSFYCFFSFSPGVREKFQIHDSRHWVISWSGIGCGFMHLLVDIWSNYSDFTRPHPKWWFSKPLIRAEKVFGKSGGLVREIPSFQGNLGCW